MVCCCPYADKIEDCLITLCGKIRNRVRSRRRKCRDDGTEFPGNARGNRHDIVQDETPSPASTDAETDGQQEVADRLRFIADELDRDIREGRVRIGLPDLSALAPVNTSSAQADFVHAMIQLSDTVLLYLSLHVFKVKNRRPWLESKHRYIYQGKDSVYTFVW